MKKLISLLLILSLAIVGAFALTACGDKDDNTDNSGSNNEGGENNNGSNETGDTANKVDYSLTVKDQNGGNVEGVEITFKIGPKTTVKATTDSNGVATINIEQTSLLIRAQLPAQLPAGYSAGESQYVDFATGAKTASITVVKATAHTVYVKDASGNAVSGAGVQVCVDGTCQMAVETDSEGKAVFYVKPGYTEAYAQFNTAPDGYTAPETVKIYFESGATEATFIVTLG